MYIATDYLSILGIANEGFAYFVTFRGSGDKSLDKAANSTSLELQRNLIKQVSPLSTFIERQA